MKRARRYTVSLELPLVYDAVRISITFGVAILALTPVFAAGQYSPGDIVFSNVDSHYEGLFGIDMQGRYFTVTARSTQPMYSGGTLAVAASPDNRSVWFAGYGGGSVPANVATLSSVAPSGVITTLHSGRWYNSIDVDDEGNAILCSNGLVLVGGPPVVMARDSQGFMTTLHAGSPLTSILGAGLDLATGDLIIYDASGGIYQMALRPVQLRLVTTLTPPSAFFLPADLEAEPQTGGLLLTGSDALFRLTLGAAPMLQPLRTGYGGVASFGGMARLGGSGHFLVCQGCDRFSSNFIWRYDAQANTVISLITLPIVFPRGIFPSDVAVARSRHVFAIGHTMPGGPCDLGISVPAEPGAAYAAAVSLGFRPGFSVGGGRTVHLAQDPLFFLSLTNTGIFSGFQGRLDALGESRARMLVPRSPVFSGVRFFVAMVTFGRGGISTVSNTMGVTIR